MIYLYAITDEPHLPLPVEVGLSHQPLATICHQDIAAVVSSISLGEIKPVETQLWQHEAVVEALMADRAVLPVRFGTALADEAATQRILSIHYTTFHANLERLRGRVEIGLRVLWDAERSQPESSETATTLISHSQAMGSGRAYMLARLAEERQAQARRQRAAALADELHERLAQLAVAQTQRLLVTPNMLLTAAYLVEREQIPAFQEAVTALSAEYPALRFLCTGPWPAYNFVTILDGSNSSL